MDVEWKLLGYPCKLNGRGSEPRAITATMLRDLAQSFTAAGVRVTVVDLDEGPFSAQRVLGWLVGVEMRGEEMWGLVEWGSASRPELALYFSVDEQGQAKRLLGAFRSKERPERLTVA